MAEACPVFHSSVPFLAGAHTSCNRKVDEVQIIKKVV
jgi:hypothetical protein